MNAATSKDENDDDDAAIPSNLRITRCARRS